MTEAWLYVNDEPLDMGKDPIPITKQAQSLGDIDAKTGSFTRSFTIPASDKNRRLLESAYTWSAKSTIPYRVTKAKLVSNGIEIGIGNLIVENNGITTEAIRLTFYTDSSPFYQQANQLTLWDCPLGVLDHFWTYDTIQNGRQPKSISGLPVIYPLLDYGDDPTYFGSTVNTSNVRADRLFPAVQLKDVLEAVGKKMGYTFTGKILNQPLTLDRTNADRVFYELYWPYSGGAWKRDTNLKARYTYTVENPTTRLVDQTPAGTLWGMPQFNGAGLPIGQRDDGGPLPIYPNNAGLYGTLVGSQYNADQITVRITLKGTATAAAPFTPTFQFGSGPDNLQPKNYNYARITNSAGTATYVGIQAQPASGILPLQYNFPSIPAGTYAIEVSADITIGRPHFAWNAVGKTTAGFYNLSNSTMRVEFLADAGTNDEHREIKLTYPDTGSTPGRPSVSWVPGYTMIPNWNAATFIKAIAQLFGCFVIANERTKTVELFQIRELYEAITNAEDWSAKLIDVDKAQWNTRSNYGQTSLLEWTNEDRIGAGYGTYRLAVNDTTLQLQKSIVKLPWGGTLYQARWTNLSNGPFYVGVIKRIDDTGKFSGPDGARLVYVEWLQGNIGPLTYKKADGTNLQTVTTNQPLTYFKGPPNKPDTLGFDNSYRWHYRWLDYLTSDYRMLTAYFNLTGGDIRSIDFRRPIYLEQFNAPFFVQKIKDWIPGKPVQVELVRL